MELKDATIIPAKQARIRFGEILDKSYYEGEQFLVVKKKTPMAIIVGVPVWKKLQSKRNRKTQLPQFKASDLGEMKIPLTREYMYE